MMRIIRPVEASRQEYPAYQQCDAIHIKWPRRDATRRGVSYIRHLRRCRLRRSHKR